jgi:hypothetical protein
MEQALGWGQTTEASDTIPAEDGWAERENAEARYHQAYSRQQPASGPMADAYPNRNIPGEYGHRQEVASSRSGQSPSYPETPVEDPYANLYSQDHAPRVSANAVGGETADSRDAAKLDASSPPSSREQDMMSQHASLYGGHYPLHSRTENGNAYSSPHSPEEGGERSREENLVMNDAYPYGETPSVGGSIDRVDPTSYTEGHTGHHSQNEDPWGDQGNVQASQAGGAVPETGYYGFGDMNPSEGGELAGYHTHARDEPPSRRSSHDGVPPNTSGMNHDSRGLSSNQERGPARVASRVPYGPPRSAQVTGDADDAFLDNYQGYPEGAYDSGIDSQRGDGRGPLQSDFAGQPRSQRSEVPETSFPNYSADEDWNPNPGRDTNRYSSRGQRENAPHNPFPVDPSPISTSPY